ncbi:MAG: translation initiation factor IF-2 subunit beta [archaeon]
MNYEQLLNNAYENVVGCNQCERFEILKVKGRHEGTRTVIMNFVRIVACLRRSAAHLIKFLSKELACSAEMRGDRLILSRKLSSKEFNEKIEKYVNLFVLCPKCKKPDTELNNEGCKTFLKCLACGNKREIHKI